MREGYDVAQVCMTGHLITSMARSCPQIQEAFCQRCGEPTLMACPECEQPIRGEYHHPDVFDPPDISVPRFCPFCGKPFPWTSRSIAAAAELAQLNGELTPDEARAFEQHLGDVVKDSPKSMASAGRLKKLMEKLASGTATSIRELIVNLVSESAKRILWP